MAAYKFGTKPREAFDGIAENATPFNGYLIARLPHPPGYHRFLNELMKVPSSYNQPEHVPDNEKALYDTFQQSGLLDIIKSIVWASGISYNGIHRPSDCSNVQCWPNATQRDNPFLLIVAKPDPIVVISNLLEFDRNESIIVYDRDNHPVLDSRRELFRPGAWIGMLLVEYARLQQDRNDPAFDSPGYKRIPDPTYKT